MKQIHLISLFLLFISNTFLLAGTINPIKVNELLEYKKEQYLKKYAVENKTKPKKASYPRAKKLKKGAFEKTKEFNIRVQNEDNKILQQKNKIDKQHTQALKRYKENVNKRKKELETAKNNLPKILSNSLNDIVNTTLGQPTIEAFVKNDVSTYNADDEIFNTTIVSKNLSIPVQIQIPVSIAQKLSANNQLKNVKPIVVFEYNDNKLYISEIKSIYKKQEFNTMLNMQNYDKEFRLNDTVNNTFFNWESKKIQDKDIKNYYTNIKKKNAKLEKQRLSKLKKQQLEKKRLAKLEKKRLAKLKKEKLNNTGNIKSLSKYTIWVKGPKSTKADCDKLRNSGLKVSCNAGKYTGSSNFIASRCPKVPDNTGKLIQQVLSGHKFTIYDWRGPKYAKTCSDFDAIVVDIGK